jgi:hypothetical protein
MKIRSSSLVTVDAGEETDSVRGEGINAAGLGVVRTLPLSLMKLLIVVSKCFLSTVLLVTLQAAFFGRASEEVSSARRFVPLVGLFLVGGSRVMTRRFVPLVGRLLPLVDLLVGTSFLSGRFVRLAHVPLVGGGLREGADGFISSFMTASPPSLLVGTLVEAFERGEAKVAISPAFLDTTECGDSSFATSLSFLVGTLVEDKEKRDPAAAPTDGVFFAFL